MPLGTADYSPNMQEIISKNPTGVLVAFGASGMARFMSQAVKARLLEKTHLFLNLMADPAVNAQLAETPVSENALGSTSYLWYYPSTPENKEFVRQYYEFMKKTGESDPIPPGSTFFSGYCSARFLTEAIKKAGTVDTEEVIDALEGMTIDTPIGPITMRSCDHQATTPVYWGRMERGEVRGLPIILVRIMSWWKTCCRHARKSAFFVSEALRRRGSRYWTRFRGSKRPSPFEGILSRSRMTPCPAESFIFGLLSGHDVTLSRHRPYDRAVVLLVKRQVIDLFPSAGIDGALNPWIVITLT